MWSVGTKNTIIFSAKFSQNVFYACTFLDVMRV